MFFKSEIWAVIYFREKPFFCRIVVRKWVIKFGFLCLLHNNTQPCPLPTMVSFLITIFAFIVIGLLPLCVLHIAPVAEYIWGKIPLSKKDMQSSLEYSVWVAFFLQRGEYIAVESCRQLGKRKMAVTDSSFSPFTGIAVSGIISYKGWTYIFKTLP